MIPDTCDSTGLAFLNNRYHDPQTGGFISVDPLVATTGEPYIYGAANPVNNSDPTGLDPDTSAYARERSRELDRDRFLYSERYQHEYAFVDERVFYAAGPTVDGELNAATEIMLTTPEPIGTLVDVGSCGSGLWNLDVSGAAAGCGAIGVPFAGRRVFKETGSWVRGLFRSGDEATSLADDLIAGGTRFTGRRFPDTAGSGATLFKRSPDGTITHYQVYDPTGRPIKRVDLTGAAHGGIPTPHVQEYVINRKPSDGSGLCQQGSGSARLAG